MIRRLIAFASSLILAALAVAAPPPGGPLIRIDNPSPDGEDDFGQSVALVAGGLIVGAPLDDGAGADAGVVHLFDGLEPAGTLVAAPMPEGARFGAALATEGEWLFVGAPRWNGSGAVFVHRGSGTSWELHAVLTMPLPTDDAWYGQAISVSGDLLVVGAPFAETEAGRSGTAFAYEWDGEIWKLAGELHAPGVASGFVLGASVAAGDGIAVVGAPYMGNSFILGAANVFARDESGWHWIEELRGSLQQGRDRYGAGVLARGRDVIVGAPRDSPPATGFVTTWRAGHGPRELEWRETELILSPQVEPFDRFGATMATDGNVLAVGAPTQGTTGAVHVFRRHGPTWKPSISIPSPDGDVLDLFGAGLDVEGSRVLIGAPGHEAGAAYLLTDSRRAAL